MYRIFSDDLLIYDDTSVLDNLRVITPKLTMEDNAAGSFEMVLPPSNVGYSKVKPMISTISVKRDDSENPIWEGRVLTDVEDFWKRRKLACEGALAFLNDSRQSALARYTDTVSGFLKTLIEIHNNKVAPSRRFAVGVVTVHDPNGVSVYTTNYESTLDSLNKNLINRFGGHVRIRTVGSTRYLDYIATYANTSAQEINFGENLLNFTKTFDMSELVTVIIPRGNKLDTSPVEDMDAYLTVASVNSGHIYVENIEAVKSYGRIEGIVDFPDIEDAYTLLQAARNYLVNTQFEETSLEISVVDLHYLSSNIDALNLLDEVHCVSVPHGMNRYFPVSKVTIPLAHPENTTMILGITVEQTLSQTNKKTTAEINGKLDKIPNKQSILKEAKENATAIMNTATNGFITITKTPNYSESLIVSETKDYRQSRKRWVLNMNGFGYTDDGGSSYKVAITMDGAIVADFITTGTLNADVIRAGTLMDAAGNTKFDLNTGVLTMKKGSINLGGRFQVSQNGYIQATFGKIGGFNLSQSAIYNDVVRLQDNGLYLNRDGYTIGKLGTNSWKNHPDQRGLVMDMEYDGHYICWGVRDSKNDDFYTVKLLYAARSSGNFTTGRLNLGCDLDGNDWLAYNFWIDPDSGGVNGGITGTMRFVQVMDMNSDGTVNMWAERCKMEFKNGLLVYGRFND